MFTTLNTNIQLGLGLIGIGRPWGHTNTTVPDKKGSLSFLRSAYEQGITYFDTAASYGTSEERLGLFIAKLTQEQRDKIIVATKFGDHWNKAEQNAFVDHSFHSLKKSLDTSIKQLKQIDLLYLHKANMTSLRSTEVKEAFAYAQSKGIKQFGASVSDEESGKLVCQSDFYSVIQLPYNQANTQFATIIDLAKANGKIVVINRPFNMGSMLYATPKQHTFSDKVDAYKTILSKNFKGAILTGTKSPQHLQENLKAFKTAQEQLGL